MRDTMTRKFSLTAIVVFALQLQIAAAFSVEKFQSRLDFVRSLSFPWVMVAFGDQVQAKCTDIDSCRELGDQKVAEDLEANPVTSFKDGVRYKVLKNGYGEDVVQRSSVVDIVYVVNSPARYMFSQGFGFEKVKGFNGELQSDLGIDSYRAVLGKGDLPLGVEEALVGMKKGEKRKIEVPPAVGFETSEWKPAPSTSLGKQAIENYKKLLKGNGPNNPPFPAPTIWQVEVLGFRN